jgi:hypothetical protein
MGTVELAALGAQERGADHDEMLEVLDREVRRCMIYDPSVSSVLLLPWVTACVLCVTATAMALHGVRVQAPPGLWLESSLPWLPH